MWLHSRTGKNDLILFQIKELDCYLQSESQLVTYLSPSQLLGDSQGPGSVTPNHVERQSECGVQEGHSPKWYWVQNLSCLHMQNFIVLLFLYIKNRRNKLSINLPSIVNVFPYALSIIPIHLDACSHIHILLALFSYFFPPFWSFGRRT